MTGAGRACLHHAANYGFEDCLDALLGRPEIETDARDSMGDTALHLAAVNGFPMCAFNLTKAAPKTCLIANNAGLKAIDVAVANDRGEVCSFSRFFWLMPCHHKTRVSVLGTNMRCAVSEG